MPFPGERDDLLVERDADGVAREIRHLVPVTVTAGSAREAALAYLDAMVAENRARAPAARLFPIGPEDIEHLRRTVGQRGRASSRTRRVSLRWRWDRVIRRHGVVESTIVTAQQIAPAGRRRINVDVLGSGIRVIVDHADRPGAFAIAGATSTLAGNLAATPALDLPDDDATGCVLVQPQRRDGFAELRPLVARRVERPAGAYPARRLFQGHGAHTLWGVWLASNCQGGVFRCDPASGSGGVRPASPSARNEALAAHADLVALDGLERGSPRLDGARVRIAHPNPIGRDGPVRDADGSFRREPRTDDFAAVSAYRHVDAMMRQVEEFGFEIDEYFDEQASAPDRLDHRITVVHRAPILPGCPDGRCVNAQVTKMPDRRSVGEMRFALADDLDPSPNPLGIATDIRWVWHEFCHALLVAGTGELEFPFAHGAGDALAAINGDPLSRFGLDDPARRGLTFPFVEASSPRRHDREVARGWGWHGSFHDPREYRTPLDPSGYLAEQILSSTLFRLYRSLGGDAQAPADGLSAVERRQAAARVVTYLVVRAIRSLGLADAVPARTAETFAAALIAADRGSRRLPVGDGSLPGGALAKVIRWAFEQQGAYHPPGSYPCNRPGPPERVDVFVDDGRGGGYGFREDPLGAGLGALAVEAADGRGRKAASAQPHRVRVRVGNRGSEAARGARVTIHAASGPGIAEWQPGGGRWTVLKPEGDAVAVRDLAAGESAVFGPFRWPARQAGEHGLLVSVSAPGDRSLIDTPLVPCGRGAPLRHLVPYDNNLLFGRWML
jgi:hypothetical protein